MGFANSQPSTWASPVSGLAAWIFARMEQTGNLATAAPVSQALTAAGTPSTLIPTFAEPPEMPVQTLWRLHHLHVAPRLPERGVLPTLTHPWSEEGRALSASERIDEYMSGLSTILYMGANVFSAKPKSLPWSEVHRIERKLGEAQEVVGYNRHLQAMRAATHEMARVGFTKRAAALYREEIRMAALTPNRADRLSHLLRLSTAVSSTGLGEGAFPLLKELIDLSREFAATSGICVHLANNVARTGLGPKSAKLFGLMLHALKECPSDSMRSRAVVGIAMAVTQAGLGEQEVELLAQAKRIAESLENSEIRRQTLSDLDAL